MYHCNQPSCQHLSTIVWCKSSKNTPCTHIFAQLAASRSRTNATKHPVGSCASTSPEGKTKTNKQTNKQANKQTNKTSFQIITLKRMHSNMIPYKTHDRWRSGSRRSKTTTSRSALGRAWSTCLKTQIGKQNVQSKQNYQSVANLFNTNTYMYIYI